MFVLSQDFSTSEPTTPPSCRLTSTMSFTMASSTSSTIITSWAPSMSRRAKSIQPQPTHTKRWESRSASHPRFQRQPSRPQSTAFSTSHHSSFSQQQFGALSSLYHPLDCPSHSRPNLEFYSHLWPREPWAALGCYPREDSGVPCWDLESQQSA